MAEAASEGRNGERDKLLILLLFETGLRVSEALSLTPRLIGQREGEPVICLRRAKETEDALRIQQRVEFGKRESSQVNGRQGVKDYENGR